jgi:tRNA (mo5U34)-methyltransferase
VATAQSDIKAAIDANPLWYHTIEVAPGVVTPGWFDLRAVVDRMPWPDVAGKRCLDVGTYDGFLAFELEKRGAAEIVATDISDHESWDWPADARARGTEYLAAVAGPEKGLGFNIAKDVLGSKVEKREISIYDLSPDTVGTFDVVVCGSLMLHLREPVRALEAIRSVCTGKFLSSEQIDLSLSLIGPRRPIARLDGMAGLCQWWVPSIAGHRRMLRSGGFAIERSSRPYSVGYGVSHPPRGRSRREIIDHTLARVLTGEAGVPHIAVLTHPRI